MRAVGTVDWTQLGSHSERSVAYSRSMILTRPTSATETIIDAVTVARLVRLIQQDDVWPMLELRHWWLARTGDTRWADLALCPFCLGTHVAALVALARYRWPNSWPWIARVLVGSAVAGHLAQLTG